MSRNANAAISDFTRMMHSLLEAGYTLNDAVLLLARNDLSPSVVSIAHQIAGSIRQGCGFSAALKAAKTSGGKRIFGDGYIAWFAGIERTGNLCGAFRAQDARLTAAHEARDNLRAVLAYPVFIVLLSLCGTAALFLKTLPWMAARGFLAPSERASMMAGVAAALMVLLALALTFGFAAYRLTGRISDESLLFSRLSEYARAGLPVSEAIPPCLPFIGERRFAEALAALKCDIAAGKPLARAFRDTGLFPSFVTDMMLVSGSTGSLAQVFDQAGAYYANRDKKRRELAARISEPAAIGITGIYLAILLESTVIPMLTGMGGIL